MRQALWIGVCLFAAALILWSHRPAPRQDAPPRPPTQTQALVPVGRPVTFTYTSVAPPGSPHAGLAILHRRTLQALGAWAGALSGKPFPYLVRIADATDFGRREVEIGPGPDARADVVSYGALSGPRRRSWEWVTPSVRVDRVGPLFVTSAIYRFPAGVTRLLSYPAARPCRFDPLRKEAVVLDAGANSGLVSGPE